MRCRWLSRFSLIPARDESMRETSSITRSSMAQSSSCTGATEMRHANVRREHARDKEHHQEQHGAEQQLHTGGTEMRHVNVEQGRACKRRVERNPATYIRAPQCAEPNRKNIERRPLSPAGAADRRHSRSRTQGPAERAHAPCVAAHPKDDPEVVVPGWCRRPPPLEVPEDSPQARHEACGDALPQLGLRGRKRKKRENAGAAPQ